ncbi:MAG: hypothetical protein AMJ55_00375 [Gammaproteobacteria bacterium SG8_15]|nr:MAG: hypothetical protein AMJ55_00375 [Gammaproteobacteria bacterium SG8_15]
MKYRYATINDLPAITKCIASTQYYGPIDASTLDGHVLLAETDDQVVACMWIMRCGRHCYLDMLSVIPEYQHSGVGVKLLVVALRDLRNKGVEYVRASIHKDNKEALRIAEAMGGAIHGDYKIAFRKLGD